MRASKPARSPMAQPRSNKKPPKGAPFQPYPPSPPTNPRLPRRGRNVLSRAPCTLSPRPVSSLNIDHSDIDSSFVASSFVIKTDPIPNQIVHKPLSNLHTSPFSSPTNRQPIATPFTPPSPFPHFPLDPLNPFYFRPQPSLFPPLSASIRNSTSPPIKTTFS